MTVLAHTEFSAHERILFAHDPVSGLRAIIALHNTQLGPAVGGCRMYPYASDAEALNDVLRLSRGMTYKSALAGLPFGGGKSVIIGDPRHEKTPELLKAMGKAVQDLGGKYIIAEDSGTSPVDMRVIGQTTEFVTGIEDADHGGDPSPATARGVFMGMKAAAAAKFGTTSLKGKRVAIQGLGHVGFNLAKLLVAEDAVVFGADLHQPNVDRAAQELGVIPTALDDILFMDCDIVAPCALGAILNAETIPQLKAKIVAGAANNQLASEADDARLQDLGILYCPDFAINAGGVIDIYHQGLKTDPVRRTAAVDKIGVTVASIIDRALTSNIPTQQAAIAMVNEKLAASGNAAISEVKLRQIA